MKILILCLLVVFASCNYNTTLAKKLAIASAAAYATDAEIAKWSCKVCAGFPLIKVRIELFRLKLSPTQFLIFMVSQAILKQRMLLSLR